MIPSATDGNGSSTRPYLLRALHDWCTDNGFTPYIAVLVDASVQVPAEYVKDSEIVLNVSFEATSGLKLGNEYVEFKARFAGVSRDIMVPVDHVIAIYARENGQGMAFPAPTEPYEPAEEAGEAEATAPKPIGLRLASTDGQAAPRQVEGDSAEAEIESELEPSASKPAESEGTDPPPPPSGGGRPSLKRIK